MGFGRDSRLVEGEWEVVGRGIGGEEIEVVGRGDAGW